MKEMFQMSLYTQLPSYFFDDYDFGIKSGCVPKFNFIPKIDKSIEDIEYFRSRLFVALRMPKSYSDYFQEVSDLDYSYNDPYDAFH